MKTLVLVRHAHRDKSAGREVDNGVSPKGKRQAARVKAFYLARFGEKKPTLLSSPKVRCVETLEPLAERLGIKITDESLLTEQAETESDEAFQRRISDFLETVCKMNRSIVIACSHGDFLPQCMEHLVGKSISLKKGAWAEFDFDGAAFNLRWLVQDLSAC